MLIRSILRWKTALALKRSCNFSRVKIERINTAARHVLWWISSQNEFKSWFMTSMHIQFLSNTSMIHNLQSRSQHPIAIFKWVMLGSWGILRGPVARICILEGCSVSSLMNLTLLTRTFSALPIFKADFYLNRRNGINNLALYNCGWIRFPQLGPPDYSDLPWDQVATV